MRKPACFLAILRSSSRLDIPERTRPQTKPKQNEREDERAEKMPPPKRPKTTYNARTKSVHTLKKKIRDAQRLLARALPSADVAAETERALASWQLELAAAQAARRERKLAQDYRMVRFFGNPLHPIPVCSG